MGFYTANPHVTVTDSFSTIAWVDVHSQIDTAAIDNLTYLTAGRLHYISTAQGDLFPGTFMWMTPEADGVIDNTNGYAKPIVWANTGSVNNVNKTLATITWYANSCGMVTLTITAGGTAYIGNNPGTTKLPYTIYVHPKAPTDFSATGVSENQIDLTWTKQTGMDKTLIRWKTGTYPTSVTDGNLLYNDTGTSTSHTGLNPGDHIFYSAWGWNDTGFYSLTYQSDDGTTGNEISGTIYYYGEESGNITVYLFDEYPYEGTPPADYTIFNPPYTYPIMIPYSFYVTDGTYYTGAFMDANSNGIYDNGEPVGLAINKTLGPDADEIIVSGGDVATGKDITLNNPPNTPSNPSPGNGATGVGINADLSWTGGDPDVGDTVTYDVYFGTTNPPTTNVSDNQSGTSYSPVTLGYSTPYYWQIVAWDNHGASTDGPIWSFTTEAEESTGNGGGGSPPPTPAPTADAGGPYEEFFVGYGITFNGSGSTGSITSYEWDFGDGNTGTGEIVTHSYVGDGTYVVNLTVTGPGGSDTNTTYALILPELNNPPTAPEVTGERDGTKNTDYNYTAVSTDLDNDTLQYIFDWGDDTNTTTDFVANGTAVTEAHNWSTWGIYTISVNAYDNDTYSGSTEYVVLIDVLYVKNIGYLIDTDSNGTYDSFYSNETLEQTSVEKLANGSYLINSDSDAEWDYIYEPETDTLTAYSLGEDEPEDNCLIWYMLGLGMLLVILLLLAIYYFTKKKEAAKKKSKGPKKK